MFSISNSPTPFDKGTIDFIYFVLVFFIYIYYKIIFEILKQYLIYTQNYCLLYLYELNLAESMYSLQGSAPTESEVMEIKIG